MRHSVTYAVDVGFVFIVFFEIGKCSIPLIGDFLAYVGLLIKSRALRSFVFME